MNSPFPFARLALLLALCTGSLVLPTAQAQVAGSGTALGISRSENTDLAMGWSAKKSLLGKSVFNEKGARIGKVEDLIISPDKRLSYVIVGVGGFVGIGSHAVAVPPGQIEDSTGRLVMAGATKDTLKALPTFSYASDSARRAEFIAAAERDVAQANTALAELEKNAATATAEGKVKIMEQIAALSEQLKSVESKLTELKSASVKRWHEFEAAISAGTARLRDLLKSGGS